MIYDSFSVAELIGPSPKATHHCLHPWLCRSPVGASPGRLPTVTPLPAPAPPTVPAAISLGQVQQHRVHQRCEKAVRAAPRSSPRRPPRRPWADSMATTPCRCCSPDAADGTRWLAALGEPAIGCET